MNDRLPEISERADKATPGPWEAHCRHVDNPTNDPAFGEQSGLGWEVDGPPEPQLRGQFASGWDATFIAHAREDIPHLLSEVRRLEALSKELAEVLNNLRVVSTTDSQLAMIGAALSRYQKAQHPREEEEARPNAQR